MFHAVDVTQAVQLETTSNDERGYSRTALNDGLGLGNEHVIGKRFQEIRAASFSTGWR
jgi:hypothetical protein